jgi:hypothetical protein
LSRDWHLSEWRSRHHDESTLYFYECQINLYVPFICRGTIYLYLSERFICMWPLFVGGPFICIWVDHLFVCQWQLYLSGTCICIWVDHIFVCEWNMYLYVSDSCMWDKLLNIYVRSTCLVITAVLFYQACLTRHAR